MSLTRRTVVASGIAATGIVTLAACAAEVEPEPVETTPPSATVDEAPQELAGEILLGSTSDVMVGSGTKFMVDESLTILVTQPKEGVFRAFSA
ncbi:MAG: iron sulfur protein, partial [Actinobacteria bacterium]|nr:iron sulfur protein [Actinomycetota bacterium]